MKMEPNYLIVKLPGGENAPGSEVKAEVIQAPDGEIPPYIVAYQNSPNLHVDHAHTNGSQKHQLRLAAKPAALPVSDPDTPLTKRVKRKPNFSFRETETLLEEVRKRGALLVGKAGDGLSLEVKTHAWECVARAVSARENLHREMHEVRKKFADLRSVFKGRTAKYKKHLKDPGADPSSLKPFTDIEKLYMKMLEQIEGGASQPEPFSFEEVQENSSEPDKVPDVQPSTNLPFGKIIEVTSLQEKDFILGLDLEVKTSPPPSPSNQDPLTTLIDDQPPTLTTQEHQPSHQASPATPSQQQQLTTPSNQISPATPRHQASPATRSREELIIAINHDHPHCLPSHQQPPTTSPQQQLTTISHQPPITSPQQQLTTTLSQQPPTTSPQQQLNATLSQQPLTPLSQQPIAIASHQQPIATSSHQQPSTSTSNEELPTILRHQKPNNKLISRRRKQQTSDDMMMLHTIMDKQDKMAGLIQGLVESNNRIADEFQDLNETAKGILECFRKISQK